MSVLKTIYTVARIPYTAAARSTLKQTIFEVVADGESDAIRQAQALSGYSSREFSSREFSWRVRGARVVVVDVPPAGVVGQGGENRGNV